MAKNIDCNNPSCDNYGNNECMFEVNEKMIEAYKEGKVSCPYLIDACDEELYFEKKKEFEEAVKPLHDWICKYGHPHMMIVMQQDFAEVLEGSIVTKLDVPD